MYHKTVRTIFGTVKWLLLALFSKQKIYIIRLFEKIVLWPLLGLEGNMTRVSQIQAKIIYISVLTFTSPLFSTDNTQDTETEDRKPKITHVDENTQKIKMKKDLWKVKWDVMIYWKRQKQSLAI